MKIERARIRGSDQEPARKRTLGNCPQCSVNVSNRAYTNIRGWLSALLIPGVPGYKRAAGGQNDSRLHYGDLLRSMLPCRTAMLPGLRSYPSLRRCSRLSALVLVFFLHAALSAQTSGTGAEGSLQSDYDSVQKYQAAEDLEHARAQYRESRAAALRRIAAGRARASGSSAKAVPVLEEAARLAPRNLDLQLEYARACLDAADLFGAKAAARAALAVNPKSAPAHHTLGDAWSRTVKTPRRQGNSNWRFYWSPILRMAMRSPCST